MQPAEHEVWRRADRILDEILDLAPDRRAEKLAALAPDPELRQHVQRLLAAHAEEDGVLDQAIPATLLPETHHGLTGRRLGRWRLLEEIGRGGMAVVYRAIADEGDAAGQLAALKVLGLGTLATEGRERFVHEQQALLRLRHPYLAQLYDTGVADDGTPWLAMALVEGERIDLWCEQREFGVEARVRMVLQLCGALSYAHRNLVIHRDIKPSNVLVDHDGHVRLLDFGIARLADHASDERTATALRALTPEYAAPEQFSGALPSTLMDVYGLGALLYRLLAGGSPRPGGLTTGGLVIAPPSRRVRTAARMLETERRARARQLRGDLDTVVMKALADKPEERYASVEALAEDLRRWMARRPIRAHAPSWRYRLGKFATRHRAAVFAGAVAMVLAGAAITQIVWQRDLAEAQARRAVAVRDFLADVFQSTDPSRGDIPDAMDLLNAGSKRAREELVQVDPMTAADVLLISGGARNALNDFERAEGDLKLALSLLEQMSPLPARELSRVHWQLGFLYKARGPLPLSVAHNERAVEWVKRWEAPVDERLSREISLAAAWSKIGRTAEAESTMRRILVDIADHGLSHSELHLDALNALTSLLSINKRPLDEQIALHEERMQVASGVYGEDTGWYAYTLADLVPTFRRSPTHLPRAEAIARQAVAITRRVYDTPHMFSAVAECNLAALLVQKDNIEEAAAHYDRSIAVDEALQRSDLHAESCRYGRASVRATLGDFPGALSDLARDREMLLTLKREHSVQWMRNCGLQGDLLHRQGKRDEAAALLDGCETGHRVAGQDLPREFLEARLAIAAAAEHR